MSIIDIDNKRISLEEFIKQNEVLLSAFGVFAALIVLSKSLSNEWFSFFFSFVWIGGLIIVWFEIWSKLPKENKMGLRLFLFRYILLWGGIGLVVYWLFEFRYIWDVALFFPATIIIFWFLYGSLLPAVRYFRITRKLFGIGAEKKNSFQKVARLVACLTAFFISFFCGSYLALGTNLILDAIKWSGH